MLRAPEQWLWIWYSFPQMFLLFLLPELVAWICNSNRRAHISIRPLFLCFFGSHIHTCVHIWMYTVHHTNVKKIGWIYLNFKNSMLSGGAMVIFIFMISCLNFFSQEAAVEFEGRALCSLGRDLITWARPPACFSLGCFFSRVSHFVWGQPHTWASPPE
jgi:hypothetical protein